MRPVYVLHRAGLHAGDMVRCARCGGAGDVRAPGPRGTLRRLEVCPRCEGAGWEPVIEAYGEAVAQ